MVKLCYNNIFYKFPLRQVPNLPQTSPNKIELKTQSVKINVERRIILFGILLFQFTFYGV